MFGVEAGQQELWQGEPDLASFLAAAPVAGEPRSSSHAESTELFSRGGSGVLDGGSSPSSGPAAARSGSAEPHPKTAAAAAPAPPQPAAECRPEQQCGEADGRRQEEPAAAEEPQPTVRAASVPVGSLDAAAQPSSLAKPLPPGSMAQCHQQQASGGQPIKPERSASPAQLAAAAQVRGWFYSRRSPAGQVVPDRPLWQATSA